METIYLTKETNEIQRVVSLKGNRNKRHRYQEFVIEGRIAIDEAFQEGWEVKALYYNKEAKLSQWADEHLAKSKYKIAYAVTRDLMEKISEKEEPTELVAVVKRRDLPFTNYKPTKGDVVVVLDEPSSPGNLGMIIRSARAFGAKALIVSGHAADETDPKCLRSSVGTFFSLPIYHVDGISSFSEQINKLREKFSVRVIASGDKGTVSLQQADFSGDLLFLILGNETSGISRGYEQFADEFLQIPLSGKFTSLNVAAAGSIFLYEIFRKR